MAPILGVSPFSLRYNKVRDQRRGSIKLKLTLITMLFSSNLNYKWSYRKNDPINETSKSIKVDD